MPDLSSKKSNYVSVFADRVTVLLNAVDDLLASRTEYDALGMGVGTGSPYEVAQGDLVGTNAYLTPQAIADAFASLDALKALFLTGHVTNLNKVRR